jgi:hypothetical protein
MPGLEYASLLSLLLDGFQPMEVIIPALQGLGAFPVWSIVFAPLETLEIEPGLESDLHQAWRGSARGLAS